MLACLQHGEEKIETWLDITETLSSMKSDENMVCLMIIVKWLKNLVSQLNCHVQRFSEKLS